MQDILNERALTVAYLMQAADRQQGVVATAIRLLAENLARGYHVDAAKLGKLSSERIELARTNVAANWDSAD